MDEDEYGAKLDAIGEVDVLCTHIPPAVPSCSTTPWPGGWRGQHGLLDDDQATRPRYALFGHVHQPLARAAGSASPSASTWALPRHRRPFVLQW